MAAMGDGEVLGHERVGSGPRGILVLNDWMSDTSAWDGTRAYLDRERFSWVFADLRGYGRSRGRAGAFTVREGAADVLALADALAWPRFAIVGHSMSTLVALDLAQHHAARVTRAVLLTPPPPSGFGADETTIEAARALARADDETRGRALSDRVGDRLSRGWTAHKVARWRAGADPEASAAYVSIFMRDGLPDREARVTTPVLAITGEQDFPFMRRAAVERHLAPLCDRYEVVGLADSGHYPMQEMPPLTVARIESFVSGDAS
jgi:3-oxoadipate enol-lactonase